MLTPEQEAILQPSSLERYELLRGVADVERLLTVARTSQRDERREVVYAARDEKTTYLNRAHAHRVKPDPEQVARFDAAIAKAEAALATASAEETAQHKVASAARAVVENVEAYVRAAYRNGWTLLATGGAAND